MKKTVAKKELKSSLKEQDPKLPDMKSEPSKPDADSAFKSNMDDLSDRISKLTIEHMTKQQV